MIRAMYFFPHIYLSSSLCNQSPYPHLKSFYTQTKNSSNYSLTNSSQSLKIVSLYFIMKNYQLKIPAHPCCGNTLLGTKCIALADLVFGLIGIFWFVFMLERYGLLMHESPYLVLLPYNNASMAQVENMDTSPVPLQLNTTDLLTVIPLNGTNLNQTNYTPFITVTPDGIELNGKSANILLSGFYTVVNLAVFVLLLSASHNIKNKYRKNLMKLEIWFYIRLFILVFKVVLYSVYAIFGVQIFPQIPHIIFMVVHAYGLWVVMVYMREVQLEERMRKARLRSLGFITVFEQPMPIIDFGKPKFVE